MDIVTLILLFLVLATALRFAWHELRGH